MSDQIEIEDIDTAKAVFEKLKDVPADRRKRILAWIAEGFGVVAASPAPPIPPTPNPAMHQPPGAPAPAAETGIDIKTFVIAKAPKSDAQFATTVAYYYRFEAPVAHKRESITSDMLQEACRLVGRNRFPTPIVTLNNAKKSWLPR